MHRAIFGLLAVLSATGCGHWTKQIPNTYRVAIERDWVPMEEGPEHPGSQRDGYARTHGDSSLKVRGDRTHGDPGFLCIEPVTPVSKLHSASAKGTQKFGKGVLAEASEELSWSQDMAKVYSLSDIVLLAQTQAFQLCLARLSGEVTAGDYIKGLEEIRESTAELVRAQNQSSEERSLESMLKAYLELSEQSSECYGKATTDEAKATCKVYDTAAERLLKAMESLNQAPSPVKESSVELDASAPVKASVKLKP